MSPPGAPHFRGVWERLVKSCKRAGVADEVLTTTMCLVELTLNARPLTAASNDPKDLEALTPNRFLLRRSSIAIPVIPNATKYADIRKAFKTSQSYSDMIWTRWLTEYQPEWNKRSKLESESERNLETGEIVWLVDEFLKRSDYKMARVN